MSQLPVYLVDAFTTTPLAGNACAVVCDAGDLDDETMLAIAREMNLSETAFVLPSDRADVRARYFTPAEEIPLAGHPTIATMFALVTTGRLAYQPPRRRYALELEAGVITVEVEGEADRIGRVVMTQLRPTFLRCYDPAEVLPVFSLPPDALVPGVPIQTVSTGTPQLMVPLRDHEALRRAQVQVPSYGALRSQGDFFSPHLFCVSGATTSGTTFARHFGVPPDSAEDPFTGSATGGMAAFLWRYGLLDEPYFTAEQGHWMNRPGEAHVEVVGPRDDVQAVKVGGSAVLVMEGVLRL